MEEHFGLIGRSSLTISSEIADKEVLSMNIEFEKDTFLNALLANIPRGKDNAVTIHDLAVRHRTSRREVEKAVEKLRKGGTAICTSCRGVFQPACDDEVALWLGNYLKRAYSILSTAAVMRRYLKNRGFYEVPGQLDLDWKSVLGDVGLADGGEEVTTA